MWSDWLVVCDCGFSLSTLWCPLSAPTVLLGFLLPWTWGISSWLLQQSAATAPYLGHGVSSLSCHSWPWVWGNSSGFGKGRGTRDQIANICWIIEKAREFQKNTNFCFIDYAKAFDCVDHNKLWKILKEMGIPDHLTCLLRNLYAGQEAIVRTGHGTTDWFNIGKGGRQGCILSPCLFNLYAEYIMRNAGLEEAQAGIKIVGRNISILRYADDTTLMAESKEELKSLLMKVKEESEKVD